MLLHKIIFILLLLTSPALADWPTENQWSDANAHRWGKEPDKALRFDVRPDIITRDGFVVEVDRVEKKYEAIGQATIYSELSGLKPMIILLLYVGKPIEKQLKHLNLAIAGCSKAKIRLEVVWVKEL